MIRNHSKAVNSQKIKKQLRHKCYGFYRYYGQWHHKDPTKKYTVLQGIIPLSDKEDYSSCNVVGEMVTQEATKIVKNLSKLDKLKIIKG